MPNAARELTRSARQRARERGITYTKAREQLLWIRRLLEDEYFETFEEADAFVSDPGNETMCRNCGWTYNMVCPECAKGCACELHCSGWRHNEFRSSTGEWDDDEDDEDRYAECGECGGEYDTKTGYGCSC